MNWMVATLTNPAPMAPLLQRSIFPFWHWLTFGRLFLAAAWIACLSLAVGRYLRSATEFDDEKRRPPKLFHNPISGNAIPSAGNYGHMEIDFGGQWLLGRMMARGYGQDLYDRNRQRQVLTESFLQENEPPDRIHRFPRDYRPSELKDADLKPDAQALMDWTVGAHNDSPRWPELGEQVALSFAGGVHPLACGAERQLAADVLKPGLADDLTKPSIGGPLYPPVHALLYAPLGANDDPRIAYYFFQLISSLSIFVSGFSIRMMTRGRIWTPVACIVLLIYPGFQPGLTLAQNHAVSLAILLAGWALNCRGKPYWGGLVWGFLAFKPVWAVVFGLVPLMIWRPRFLAGMATSGLALVVATLPFVGIHGWQNWLTNGGEATKVYNRNSNWINLSRDLSGIVRRMTLDFDVGELERNVPQYSLFGPPKYSLADLISWALLLAVFATTVVVYRIWGRSRQPLGLAAGFLFLGFYLCCFRFMYYDAMLSAVGVVALFAYPKWYLGHSTVTPVRIAVLQWYPITLFVALFLLGMALIPLRAAATVNWVPYSDRQFSLSGPMDTTSLAVWGGILNVLLIAAYWLIFRVGRKSQVDDAYADPTARTRTVMRNSVSLTILAMLLLLHTYFLQLRPDATLQLLSDSEKPRSISAAMNYDYATDTFLVIALWLWAGWRMVRGGERPEDQEACSRSSAAPISDARISDSPTSTA